MKKLILLLIISTLSIISFNAKAQFADDAVWHYNFHVYYNGFYKIQFGQDTIIGNTNCKKFITKKYVFYSQPNGLYIQGPIQNMPPEYTYTSGDTVFYFKNDKFYPLFIFNANIGDEWVINDKPNNWNIEDSISKVKVIDTTSYNINGFNLKAIKLETQEDSPFGVDGWVVEKIGPLNSQYLFPTGRSWSDSTIVCFEMQYFKCYEDSTIGLVNPNGIECEYLLNHVGINESETNNFAIYPNPTSDIINIEFSETGEYQLSLYDNTGRIIISENIRKPKETIKISKLPYGIYFLKIMDKDATLLTKKIVKY